MLYYPSCGKVLENAFFPKRESVKNRESLKLAIVDMRERINQLLEPNLEQTDTEHSVTLKASFTKNTMAWRNLKLLTGGKTSFRQFVLPDFFFEFEHIIKLEFMRGIADAAGFIRKSNYYHGDLHRLYLQIANKSWVLPIQLCALLQEHLDVHVQLIQWGHPNVREPNVTDVSPKHTGWAREHQVKIFAQDFLKVGFTFNYKQEILEEFAAHNQKLIKKETKECNPKQKSVYRAKPQHPCEGSAALPPILRGRHFHSYWQICQRLGCTQGTEGPQQAMDLYDEED